MVPRLPRRRYLSGLALTSVTVLAGCSDTADSSPNSTPTSTNSDSTPSESAAATVRAYFQALADDPLAIRDYVHPIHPLHPNNLSDETATERISVGTSIADVQASVTDESVTPEMVLSTPLYKFAEIDRTTVADALDDAQTAVVETTVTTTTGTKNNYRILTVTVDGEWAILAQQPEATRSPEPALEARVVEKVTFDTETNRARVHFVDSPVADSVTVRSAVMQSSQSTDTPGAIEYLDVSLHPDGDEVLVTATLDGKSRPVHREQYPPSKAVVRDVTYDTDRESKLYDAIARVEFTGEQSGEKLTVTSTVEGYEGTFTPAGDITFVNVGINSGGDEIVVRLTKNGTTSVVHRERYHP